MNSAILSDKGSRDPRFAETCRQIVVTLGIANYVLDKKIQRYFFSHDCCLELSLCAYLFKFFENCSETEMVFNCFLIRRLVLSTPTKRLGT